MSDLIARPRPPGGALIARSSVRRQLPTGTDVVNQSALEGGEGEGVAEEVGRQVEAGVQFAVNYLRGDRTCFIAIKSDTLVRMVTLTNVNVRTGPGQSRVGHSS